MILADDQGWGDLSASGNVNLSTPHLDSLARDGASFERFYVQPVCAPTRAELLTGRYHPRTGVWGVTTGGERLDLDERTIADHFRAAGYATGCFGKWHNGTQYPYHPRGRGFDTFYGYTSGHWGDYFSPPLDHDGRLVQGDGYLADDLTARAIRFVESHASAGRPFFCYLAMPTPHTPAQVPDRFFDKFAGAELRLPVDGEDIEKTRAVLAMCENIDWNVGRLLARLDELKLAQDTIVVYLSDNGPNGPRWNGGMRGTKGSTDEGGVRSVLFLRWPGHVRPGTRLPQVAGAIDLLPTLTDLCDVNVAGGKPLDGVSHKAALLGGDAPERSDRLLFASWNGKVAVRSQRYRLDDRGRLYDMDADPGQKRDVTADNPVEARRLGEAVASWRRDVLGQLRSGRDDDRPLPVGHPDFPAAQLEARDGTPHGAVRRSASAPNCSFFTNWIGGTDDAMSWDVSVVTPGRYEVVVYYTCPPADIGATVELSWNGVRLTAKVAEPHDPPLRGMEHDRIPRLDGESYVKDFRPLSLGTMHLVPGRGPLTLRATDVPGRQVVDVRMIVLTLLK